MLFVGYARNGIVPSIANTSLASKDERHAANCAGNQTVEYRSSTCRDALAD